MTRVLSINRGQMNQARTHMPARPERQTTMVFHCAFSCLRLMTVPMWVISR